MLKLLGGGLVGLGCEGASDEFILLLLLSLLLEPLLQLLSLPIVDLDLADVVQDHLVGFLFIPLPTLGSLRVPAINFRSIHFFFLRHHFLQL